EGRPSKLQPSPEGLGYQSQADLSAVGAALNLGQLASLSLGAYPDFLFTALTGDHVCGSP
ncbi:MAG: hypothetical protein WCD57_04345, partial [Acidobacteriaceae bacterium]